MSENIFIQKRKRARGRSFLTIRFIFSLIFLSFILLVGFYLEFGSIGDSACTGACESQYSIYTWLLGAGLLLGSIITLAAIVGIIVAALRRVRKKHDGLEAFISSEKDHRPH
ncbi:hypothetical protein [Kordiimonas pumila]|uniref:Transmembrane protein n=1 Tax=Kordiimonas pumila TaxID=2161677 RepID=A0ABV7CZM9_9PROT|nr:hypothetical protein [Kordiimonas pumila]